MNSLTQWPVTVEGVFREFNFLATGISTDRVPEDDIVVVAVHFTKDNGELSSITLDDNSKIELEPAPGDEKPDVVLLSRGTGAGDSDDDGPRWWQRGVPYWTTFQRLLGPWA